ncbi:MAG: TlpA family protein disulfide reductase [Prevotellaceae bacterium]|jgi:thiol-disulfide isomerase/thioredoxin|nr:TlpA family protein disulfide reductase [Prevotellaceae bacterium]
MKTKAFPYIFVPFLLYSCNDGSHVKETTVDPHVVVCFDAYNPQAWSRPSGAFREDIPKVLFVGRDGIGVSYYPNVMRDTLRLDCPNSFVELALSYRNHEYIYYPLRKGDTITVTMDSLDYPLIASKHHPQRDRIYNIPYRMRQKRTHLNLEASTCLGDDILIHIAHSADYLRTQEWGGRFLLDYCPMDSLILRFDDYQKAYMDTIRLYKQREWLSDELYERYHYYLRLKQLLSERILNKDSIYYERMEGEMTDDKFRYPSYYEYLDEYMWYFLKHIPLIRENTSGGGGSYSDWLQAFDEVSKRSFQPRTKQFLLARCIDEIAQKFSAEEIDAYLKKYVAVTHDSLRFRKIVEQYNLSADVNQLLLEDMQGNTTHLQQLLDQYKGKVLYIDFWASWCVPCRSEMPPAAELRKQFDGQDVVFVYLAWKDHEEEWQKASRREGLSKLSTNYFIQNSTNSKFLDQIGLHYIPRYLVFDRSGKLVEMNAPRPSSMQAAPTLNKYLNR